MKNIKSKSKTIMHSKKMNSNWQMKSQRLEIQPEFAIWTESRGATNMGMYARARGIGTPSLYLGQPHEDYSPRKEPMEEKFEYGNFIVN
jgi:hypothetical protein